jgi:hypothetical protein
MNLTNQLEKVLTSSKFELADNYVKMVESSKFKSFKKIQNTSMKIMGVTSDVIQKTLNPNNNLSFDKFNGFYFRIKRADTFIPEVTNEAYAKLSWELHKKIIISFWKENPKLKLEFDKTTSFDSFDDIRIPEVDRNKFIISRRHSTYNSIGWANYFQELNSLFYDNFYRDTRSRKADVRFIKELNNGYFIGFEYDNKSLKSEIHKGYFNMPEFKIILLDKDFKRNTKVQFKTFDEVGYQLLSKIDHPFSQPFRSIGTYTSLKCKEEKLDLGNQICKEEKNGELIHFTGNKDFGRSMKEYLFIYIYYQSLLNKNYLSFFEDGILALEV